MVGKAAYFLILTGLLLGMGACRAVFSPGESGEHLVVVDKSVPDKPGHPTAYTVKNVTPQSGIRGSRIFQIQSRHIFQVGDTVQMYDLERAKSRGI